MRSFRFIFVLLLACLCAAPVRAEEEAPPRSIVLLIGDGMGEGQVRFARLTKGTPGLDRFKITGLLTTHSLSGSVTDSAAAGTALATGEKARNGCVALSPQRKPLKTLLEFARDKGKSAGIVVTCSLTHATPAAFYAHIDNRGSESAIAEQFIKSGINVLFGGGAGYFVPGLDIERAPEDDDWVLVFEPSGGSKLSAAAEELLPPPLEVVLPQKTQKNLLGDLQKKMKVVRTVDEFRALKGNDNVAGLLTAGHLAKATERGVSLAEMTRKALGILSSNDKGFCLMVEGSQIDWACHGNNKNYLIGEMVDFDKAVGQALDFAEKDGRTLVIATADHETGGLTVGPASDAGAGGALVVKFSTGGHTGAMVPIFAFGPGSSAFAGEHDNTFVGKKTIEYVGGPRVPATEPQRRDAQ